MNLLVFFFFDLNSLVCKIKTKASAEQLPSKFFGPKGSKKRRTEPETLQTSVPVLIDVLRGSTAVL